LLYNLEWLKTGELFPPSCEKARIERYIQNAALFDGEHFADTTFRSPDGHANVVGVEMYRKCAARISRVIGNFEDVISFPVLLNYQRLMTLKMADLVCGEYPTITGRDATDNKEIKRIRDVTDFDSQLYSCVIDISRYGDAVQRLYINEDGEKTFTNWDPKEWFPVVAQDGTNRITHHVLCWKENRSTDVYAPDWYLHAQIHPTAKKLAGTYEYKVFKMDAFGRIGAQLSSTRVATGFDRCAVSSLKSFSVTNTVYGYDDYLPIDSLLAEIMTRIGQISVILDKHADPNITGPVSMLTPDPNTGEFKLKTGKFYAVSPGEEQPKYMVWEGHLESAFSQLELLINQLYILSEMGAALLGSQSSGSQAISGTAMRFKMVNPLAKARRIANALTRPVRKLFAALSDELEYSEVSVFWADGLPDDPRENIEMVKLATGQAEIMPLEVAIVEYFNRSNEEAIDWMKQIEERKIKTMETLAKFQAPSTDSDPNKPGPQDGTGVNPDKKGSDTGLNNFHGLHNK
jgi:hypothetical protein